MCRGAQPNPKMGDQLGYALEEGVPFMVLFGEDEMAQGVVKIKVCARAREGGVEVEEGRRGEGSMQE